MLLTLPGQIGAFKESRNAALARALHGELLGLRDEMARALDSVAGLEPADIDLEVTAAPVYLNAQPMLIYRGVFDGGDLHLFRGCLSFLVGLMDVLVTQDLRGDVFGLVNQVSGGGLSLDFAGLGALLVHLLDSEGGHFFDLNPDDGAASFADARGRLSAVGAELLAAVDWMRHAPPDQRLQVSEVREGAPGAFSLLLANAATVDADGVVFEAPYTLDLTEATLAALKHTSDSIAGPAGSTPPVDFRTEFVLVLSAVLHPAFKLGIVDAFAGKLPINVGGLNRRALEALLGQLLPLPVALDFGAFFDAGPVGLRFILPETVDGNPPHLVAEWECPGDLDATGVPSAGRGFLCGDAAELVDVAHFDGAMAADGLALRGPYLRFADPTLRGLLQVDLSGAGAVGWDAPGFRVPDAAATATAFALGLGPLFGVLGGAGN